MRHPLREKERIVFRKYSLIESQQKLASVWPQTLDRVRKASWEIPQIALADVVDKNRPVRIEQGNACISVEHNGPLIGCMPMQFAKATRGEAHVDAGDLRRRRQLALGHLMGPTALLNSLVGQVKGVPDGPDISVISGRRCV